MLCRMFPVNLVIIVTVYGVILAKNRQKELLSGLKAMLEQCSS